MPLRGIVFDLDGVLVDTVPAHMAAWKRLFDEEGYHFDEQVYREKVDGRPREDGVRAVMEDAGDDRVLLAARRKEAYFLELIARGGLQVFEGSATFLAACHKLDFHLATASSSRNVRHILEQAGLVDYFTAIVGGDDIERGKPDPGIFIMAAARMGLDATNCLVVEDAAIGVRAAKAGGFYCVGIDRTGDGARLAGADIVARDLGEIEPLALARCFKSA